MAADQQQEDAAASAFAYLAARYVLSPRVWPAFWRWTASDGRPGLLGRDAAQYWPLLRNLYHRTGAERSRQ